MTELEYHPLRFQMNEEIQALKICGFSQDKKRYYRELCTARCLADTK